MKARVISIAFDTRAMEIMNQLEASTGKSRVAVFHDAIGFYNWARQQVEAGRCIAVVDHAADSVTEYILPFRSLKKEADGVDDKT